MDFENKDQVLSLFETVDFAVITLDNELHYTYLNKKALEILRRKKEELLGNKITDIYPHISHTEFGKYLKLTGKTGKPQEWEYYSSFLRLFLRAHAHKTDTGIVVLFTDITEKYELEKLLQEKLTLLDLSFDAIQMQDENNKVLYWNKGAERIYGWKVHEIIGKVGYKIFGTEFPGGRTKFFGKLRKNKQWVGPLQHVTKEKKRIIVDSAWSLLERNGKTYILEITRDITQQELAKQQLILNEKKFRSMIENSSDGILITDEQLRIRYISPSITRILGYDPSRLVNLPLSKFMDQENYSLIVKNHKKLLATTDHLSAHYKVRNKKGEARWIDVRSTNLIHDPAVGGIVSNFRDITEIKVYESELEEKNKKITEILEKFNYAYYAIGKDWKYIYVNKEGEKLAKRKKEDMLGKSVWDIFPEALNLESGKAMKKVMQKKTSQEYDVYYPPFKKWYHHYLYPSTEGIALYAYDITDKKNIEQQMLDTQQELETILKNISSGVMVQDISGGIVYANDEAARLAGYQSVEEMMHAPRYDYVFKFELRDEYGKKYPLDKLPGAVAYDTGKSAKDTINFINKQTGKSWWLSITSTVVYRGHERNPLIVSVIQDITEFKDIDVRKNDFISMTSHELKTPLTSLKVYMHLLSNLEKLDDAKRLEYLAKASDQLDKLQLLISELLDQSTIQQGKLSLHVQEMYFDFFIREFIRNYQETVSGIKIVVKGKTDCIVKIDRYRMEQVLANLLSNAIKYSTEKKEITITMSRKDGFVFFSVKDFGMGIPTSELPNIFKPYYRVMGKKENTFPGLGMGLYIAKDIIVKHGGEITVMSTPGKGTIFTFSLPLVQ